MYSHFYVCYDIHDNVICCGDTIALLLPTLGVSRRTIERAFARVYGIQPKNGHDVDLLRSTVCTTRFGLTKIFMYNASNW